MSKVLFTFAWLAALGALFVCVLQHGGCSEDADSAVHSLNDPDHNNATNETNSESVVRSEASNESLKEGIIGLNYFIIAIMSVGGVATLIMAVYFCITFSADDEEEKEEVPLVDLPAPALDESSEAEDKPTQAVDLPEESELLPTQSLHSELDQVSGSEEKDEKSSDNDQIELIPESVGDDQGSAKESSEQPSVTASSGETPSTDEGASAGDTEEVQHGSDTTATEVLGDKDTDDAAPSDQDVELQADVVKEEVGASEVTSDAPESEETEALIG